MYDVQFVNMIFLQSMVKPGQPIQPKGKKTEWPRDVNQAFIPNKLGLPVKVEFRGIASKPSATFGIDLGRTSRRLLLRRLMASCTTINLGLFLWDILFLPRTFSHFQAILVVTQMIDTSCASLI